MAVDHAGNVSNQLLLEEHDGQNNAKRVSIVAGAVGQATVTLMPSPSFIGIVTVANPVAAGNVTLDPGSRTGIVGNVTLSDSKGFIGLTTTTLGASPAFIGIVTVTNKDRTITGNLTLSDSKTFIGLTTTTLGAGDKYIGLASVNIGGGNVGINGNVTLSDSKGFIGLTTTTLGASPAFIGIATVIQASSVRSLVGNLTLSDAKTFIGLTTSTLGASPAFVGIVTVTNRDRTITGNLTLTDAKSFIGLVTITGSAIDIRSLNSTATLYAVVNTGGSAANVTLNPSPNFIGLATTVIGTPFTPSTLVHGMVSSASGSLVQFPTNSIKWLTLKSSLANVTTVYVGGSSATINNGMSLEPGDMLGLSIDNTNKLYLVGVGTTEVRYIGGN